jgi:hypothetical protein
MSLILDGTNGATFNDGSILPAAPSPYVLKNRIINGDMRIDQRNAGAAFGTSINGYTIDRWRVSQSSSTGKLNGSRNYNSVTTPTGFTNYLGVQSQSAYAISSGDFYAISQLIEGFNIADLAWGTANAKTVTLSFQVYSSLTGTFGGAIRNGAGNRAYPFSYTISSANTWTQISITITGDTTGTWSTDNSDGLELWFGLGVGSTLSGTANSWSANGYISATGATSVVGTSSATFYITGVQLEQNTSATPFERRLYGQELANCQRYFAKVGPTTDAGYAQGISNTTSQGYFVLHYKVTMRTTPTFAYISSLAMTDNQNYNSTVSAIAGFYGCPDSCRIALNGAASMTQYRPATLVNVDTTGSYTLSAEL